MKHLRTASMMIVMVAACSCSKVDIKPAQNQGTPDMTLYERIVEIDRLLSMPLTGRPEDADRRATLRAERDALTGGSKVTTQNSTSAISSHRPQQQQQVVVARDSRQHDLSSLEQLTPTERKRYYEALRITYPNPIVPFYYAPPRDHFPHRQKR